MYDPRWDAIARDWLADSELPDALVTIYTARLAQELQNTAEWFVNGLNAMRQTIYPPKSEEPTT